MCAGVANRSIRSFCAPSIDQCCGLAYLSCVCELKGSESGLQVGGVGLKVIEGTGDARFQLRGILAGRRIGSYLVQCRHLEFEFDSILDVLGRC